MKKYLTIGLIAFGAALLVITGAIAGVLVADSGGGSKSSQTSSSTTGKGYLGLTVSYQGNTGLRVATVESGGPAAAAGIEAGDVLRSVDGQLVRTPEQLRSATESKQPGTSVTLTYERGDQELRAQVKLGDAPANAQLEAPTPGPGNQQQTRPAQVQRGRLGVQVQPITPELKQRLNLTRDSGIVITEVTAGGPAASAGFQRGDVIVSVGTTTVTTVEQLQRLLTSAPANQPLDIAIERGGQQLSLKATLPAQAGAQGLENLPPQLREQVQRMIDQGNLSKEQLDRLSQLYQNRGDALRMGTVAQVSASSLTLKPLPAGGEVTVPLNDTTTIFRGGATIQPSMLKTGETVMVISLDGGATAFSVYAFGMLNLNP